MRAMKKLHGLEVLSLLPFARRRGRSLRPSFLAHQVAMDVGDDTSIFTPFNSNFKSLNFVRFEEHR